MRTFVRHSALVGLRYGVLDHSELRDNPGAEFQNSILEFEPDPAEGHRKSAKS